MRIDPLCRRSLRKWLRDGGVDDVNARLRLLFAPDQVRPVMIEFLADALDLFEKDALRHILDGNTAHLRDNTGLHTLRLLPGQPWHDCAREVLDAYTARRRGQLPLPTSNP